jgi:hypothetical protein
MRISPPAFVYSLEAIIRLSVPSLTCGHSNVPPAFECFNQAHLFRPILDSFFIIFPVSFFIEDSLLQTLNLTPIPDPEPLDALFARLRV